MAIYLVGLQNPDSSSIAEKSDIDLSVSLFDVSASGHYGKIQTNYTNTQILVNIPEPEYLLSSSYYTPLYTEKLNYDTWLSRINRNFEELN